MGKFVVSPQIFLHCHATARNVSHTNNNYYEWPRGVMKIVAHFNAKERINAASNISCKDHCYSLAVTIILLDMMSSIPF